jgi:hypothetical protein
MSIKSWNEVERPAKIQVDLTGPDGNAFVLLGMGKRWAKDLDIDWDPIQEKAMSGDYENLLLTIDEAFGDYVDFIR